MVAMPAPDQTVLERREQIVAALREIVPGEGVIANDIAMTGRPVPLENRICRAVTDI